MVLLTSVGQTTGITIVERSRRQRAAFTFNGTESDINAALEGMTFTPDERLQRRGDVEHEQRAFRLQIWRGTTRSALAPSVV